MTIYVALERENEAALAALYGRGLIGAWNGLHHEGKMYAAVPVRNPRAMSELRAAEHITVMPSHILDQQLTEEHLAAMPCIIADEARARGVTSGRGLANIVKDKWGDLSFHLYPDL